MLIHGLFGSLDNLAVIRRDLDKDFQVLSVDLPDHGLSSWSSDFSFADYAEQIVALLDHLGLEQVHLLGHSLGGKVAMYLALHHPSRVTSLLVADIAPVAYPARHEAVLAGLNAVDLQSTTSRNHANEQMAEHIVEPGVRQFLLKSLYQTNSGWNWRFNLTLLQRDYALLSGAIESDNQFTDPVLFVKGGQSDYLLSEHRPAIGKLFPNSQAKIIQGTGHWLHAEKPHIFNRVAREFLIKA